MPASDPNRSTEPVIFGCLDRQRDIDKYSGENLPHWFQAGSAVFVTFRTADSMPREVILHWQAELAAWLERHGLPTTFGAAATTSNSDSSAPESNVRQQCRSISVPTEKLAEFNRLRERAWHRSLDGCHGKCLLKQPELARMVAAAILFHNGIKYDLDRFIVMPNHVHAIVQFRPGSLFDVIGQSWMRYAARKINLATGQSGRFWQSEPFDHLIRSGRQFAYLQHYVADNAKKAKLRDGEFLYWQRP